MPEHTLLAVTSSVEVMPPVEGQVLVGNCAGCWEAKFLADVYEPFGEPPVVTAALTTITPVAPGTPDYAITDVTATVPYGFADAEEARTVLAVIANLQTRLAEVETQLRALGIVA